MPAPVEGVRWSNADAPADAGGPGLDTRIARALQEVEQQGRRVGVMKARLQGVSRTGQTYALLLPRLHLFERCMYNAQLELDALLRERRRRRTRPTVDQS